MADPSILARLVPPDPDLSRLPVTVHTGATPLYGVILILAGAVLPVAIYVLLSILGWIAEVPPEWPWVKLFFAVIPLGALPWGWWVLKTKTTVEISETAVTRTRTTPLGSERWSAPRASYTGLTLRKILPSTTAKVKQTRYLAEMQHPDPARVVALSDSFDEGTARHLRDRLAELTGLPKADL